MTGSATAQIDGIESQCTRQHAWSGRCADLPDLIATARESTRTWLESGGLQRSEFPGPLTAHTH